CFRTSQSTAELASNPQMAAMLAMLAADGSVPQEQASLFDRLSAKLIGNAPVIRKQLMRLAAHLQLKHNDARLRSRSVPFEEACSLFAGRSPGDEFEVSRQEAMNRGERTLRDLALKSGLLRIDGDATPNRFVQFRYPEFQEYLAACHFAEEG